MQIQISGHHIDVTDAMRDYTTKKLSRLNKHTDHITNLNVVLSVDNLIHVAKANIHISGAILHAESKSENMYAAIDGLIDKLSRQAESHKGKQQHHSKGSGEELL